MDRTESAMRKLLAALPSHGYDLGVLADRRMQRFEAISASRVLRMLPYLKHRNAHGAHIYLRPTGESCYSLLDDLTVTTVAQLLQEGFAPAAVVETSPGSFQAWLRHKQPFSNLLGTLTAKMLAQRFGADSSAADWRRFGRAPGFTNRKQQHRNADGLYPFAVLREHAGSVYPAAESFRAEVIAAHAQAEVDARRRILCFAGRPVRNRVNVSLSRFRGSLRYRGSPAAADLAFSIYAGAHGWSESEIADALRAEYLSRDIDSRRQNAYLRRTIGKALQWIAQ